MREILFRGKGKDGQWIEGNLIHLRCEVRGEVTTEVVKIHPIKINGPDYPTIVEPKTVGQYTGLKDKNGKKIFEGDIFKFPDESWSECFTSCGMEYDSAPVENYAVVGFHEDTQAPDFVQYKFGDSQVEADLHENHDVEFYDFISELEVVGNIHDNPDLMEAQP